MFNKERIEELERTVKDLKERIERLEYTTPINFRKFVKEHRYIRWQDLYWLDREYVRDHVRRFDVAISPNYPDMTEYRMHYMGNTPTAFYCYSDYYIAGINDMCLGEIVEWCQKRGGKDEREI